jgi:Domain of Unknown Function (DUF1521)
MVASVGNTQPSNFSSLQSSPPIQRTTRNGQGDAVYESDHYKITCNTRGEITILNKQSGETYFIWGDPHMNVDGVHSFDFKESSTLILADGTKVTIDTEPWGANGATVASRVTITKGEYGVQLDGVSPNNMLDEVTIAEFQKNGYLLDKVVADGNIFFENNFGTGFLNLVQNSAGFSVDATTQALVDQAEASEPGGMFDRSTTSNTALAGILADSGGAEFLTSYLDPLRTDKDDLDVEGGDNDDADVDEAA